MRNQISFIAGVACLTCVTLFSFSPSFAQGNSELAIAISNAQKANRTALTNYSWKMEAEMKENGEMKAEKLYQARFDTEGKLEFTETGGTTVDKKPGVRGAIQKSAVGNKKEYVADLLNIFKQYAFMTTGQMVDYFEKAMIINDGTSISVSGKGVLAPNDLVKMTCDSKTYMSSKLSFTATLDGDEVQGEVIYKAMENGPTRTLKLELKVPAKGKVLTAEMFDYIKQQ